MNRPDTDEIAARRARVAAMHATGMSQRDIARDLGASQATIARDVLHLNRNESARATVPAPPGADPACVRLLGAARVLPHVQQLDMPDRMALLAVLALTVEALERVGPGAAPDRAQLDIHARRLAALARQPVTKGRAHDQ